MNFIFKRHHSELRSILKTIPRPESPAYFTGNPFYFTHLQTLHQYLFKFNLPKEIPPQKITIPWMNINDLSKKCDMKLKPQEYHDFIQKLTLLHTHLRTLFFIFYSSLESSPDDSASQFLKQFFIPGASLVNPYTAKRELDEHGRSFTLGSKKTARAQVWLIPGKGDIMINSYHFSDYFTEQEHLDKILEPFEISKTLGNFNVWAIVKGSGKSSQAHAVSTAVARGLTIHQPELLESEACILFFFKKISFILVLPLTKMDTRQVERKKTGQPKARKKMTWYFFLLYIDFLGSSVNKVF